jgi:hypothetical protein
MLAQVPELFPGADINAQIGGADTVGAIQILVANEHGMGLWTIYEVFQGIKLVEGFNVVVEV